MISWIWFIIPNEFDDADELDENKVTITLIDVPNSATMIEFENKKDGENREEEKIDTTNNKRITKWETQIRNARETRSQNRNEFTQLKFTDPRIARQELPLEQAKESRQKMFKETRMENQEKPKNGKGKEDQNDPKYLSKMIKEMTQAVNNYLLTTTQEIDNIKKIVETNHKSSVEVKEKINNITRDVDIRIQNIINIQKEITSKHETLKSLVEGMIEKTQNIQADREYVEHKQLPGTQYIKKQKQIKTFSKPYYMTNIIIEKQKLWQTIKKSKFTQSQSAQNIA